MNVICVLFLLCLPSRSSFVSVVFDFSASLNDAAPVSLILLPVVLTENEKYCLAVDVCNLCCFFCLHLLD